jgi:hypothetical protein
MQMRARDTELLTLASIMVQDQPGLVFRSAGGIELMGMLKAEAGGYAAWRKNASL